MTSPPSPPPQTPLPLAASRWLWVARGATLLLLLLFIVGLTTGGPVGLIFPILFYFGALINLRRKTLKAGLAYAAVGSVLVLLFGFGGAVLFASLSGLHTLKDTLALGAGILAIVAVLGTLVASVIRVYRILGREAIDRGKLVEGAVVAIICLIVMTLSPAMSDPFRHNQTRANQASAVGSVRTINTAEITYASSYTEGFSPSLAALGEGPPGASPSRSAAGLIDPVLASGTKSGYTFTYTPGPRDSNGRINSYTVVARPIKYGKTGLRSFFTDESGVIRQTAEDRPATAKDPPLAG